MNLKENIKKSIEICDEQIKGIEKAIENNTLATSSIEELKERIVLFEFVKTTLQDLQNSFADTSIQANK